MAADEPIELGYYGAVVRRHAVLVASIACVGAVGALVMLGGTKYSSSAEVLIKPISSAEAGNDRPDQLINTNTEQQIATSVAVAELAADTLGEEDADALLDHLEVRVPLESQVLVFRYKAGEAGRARAGAQAFAEAYLDFRSGNAIAARDAEVDNLTAEIGELTTELAEVNVIINDADSDPVDVAQSQARREQLLAELRVQNDSLGAQRNLRIDPGDVIAAAGIAEVVQTSTFVLLVLGAVVGALAGAALAFVRDRVQARANTVADVEAELGAPVLATIPAVAWPTATMVTRTDPHAPRRTPTGASPSPSCRVTSAHPAR